MSNRDSREVNNSHSFLKVGVDMIISNQKLLNRLYILIDACTIVVAYVLAYYIRFYSPFYTLQLGTYYSLEKYLVLLVHLVPAYLFVYYIFGLYSMKLGKQKWIVITNIILSNIFGMAFFALILYFIVDITVSRRFIILFLVINVVLLVCSRMLFSLFSKGEHRKS